MRAPRSRFGHVLYCPGGLIAIGARSLFMTMGLELAGAWAGLVIEVCYGVVVLGLTHKALDRRLELPAGIFATLAPVMVPLVLSFAQSALGRWDDPWSCRRYHTRIDGRWLLMELGTLIGLGIVGVGVLWQRHEAAWTKWLHAKLPCALRELLEARAVA